MSHRVFASPGYMHRDPRLVKAGNAAVGLWTLAGQWDAANRANGFIPNWIVNQLGTQAQAKRLVKALLWEPAFNGYQFVPAEGLGVFEAEAARNSEHRTKAAERARRYRARKKEREAAMLANTGV